MTKKLASNFAFPVFILALLLYTSPCLRAEVRLPAILGNDMVLQRDMTVNLWGWAAPGEDITITLDAIEVKTQADDQGRWQAKLPAQPAGGPRHLIIAGTNRIEFNNILFGEVWIASGQSNMAWQLKQADGAQEAMAAANYPDLRLFQVPRVTSGEPLENVQCSWTPCNSDTAGNFSAVAFFFGLELRNRLNVPVGMIASSWGGTRAEPWTPKEGFAAVTSLASVIEQIDQAKAAFRKKLSDALPTYEQWITAARHALDADTPIPLLPALPAHGLDSNQQPTGLYNAMIHPLVPYTLRGAIWYQGEANLADGALYTDKMQALILGWRKVWNLPEMPFYFAQLAPYHYGPEPFKLPEIWQAQTKVLAVVPHTGMAVTNDIGNIKDIHPRNKHDVGKRLALWALAKTYEQKDLVYSGPLYQSLKVEGNKIRVFFNHVGTGLASRDGKELTFFEIADASANYLPAQAVIDGDSVLVWSDQIAVPTAVRFAWNQDAQPNLMNKEGLPAAAFSAIQ